MRHKSEKEIIVADALSSRRHLLTSLKKLRVCVLQIRILTPFLLIFLMEITGSTLNSVFMRVIYSGGNNYVCQPPQFASILYVNYTPTDVAVTCSETKYLHLLTTDILVLFALLCYQSLWTMPNVPICKRKQEECRTISAIANSTCPWEDIGMDFVLDMESLFCSCGHWSFQKNGPFHSIFNHCRCV